MYQETYRAVEEALKDATGAEDVFLGDGEFVCDGGAHPGCLNRQCRAANAS